MKKKKRNNWKGEKYEECYRKKKKVHTCIGKEKKRKRVGMENKKVVEGKTKEKRKLVDGYILKQSKEN